MTDRSSLVDKGVQGKQQSEGKDKPECRGEINENEKQYCSPHCRWRALPPEKIHEIAEELKHKKCPFSPIAKDHIFGP